MTAINDPHYWYELARRTFTQAKAETDKSLRDTMYAIAVTYHRLADGPNIIRHRLSGTLS